jgi:hypothetical protein
MIIPPMTHQPGAITNVGIDLHLGQKPKLGGRYADNSLIYTSYFVGTLYIHVLLSFSLLFLFLFLLSKIQKDQKYFHYFSLFASLVFYSWFALLSIFGLIFEKSKKILLCLLFPFVLVLKFKNPKIFVVLLQFCKVCYRVWSLVTPLELGYHFILFKPNK